jgi:hypothetical protein
MEEKKETPSTDVCTKLVCMPKGCSAKRCRPVICTKCKMHGLENSFGLVAAKYCYVNWS